MNTIKDVAKYAGVSVVTISRYFNSPDVVSQKTKLKIESAIKELDYHPNEIARSLVKKKTNVIGVLISDIKNTFFNSLFRSAESFARKFDYSILLCNTDENQDLEMNYLRLLISQRVDGIIIVPSSKKSVEFLMNNNIKFILVDRLFDEISSDYITTDHYKGSAEITTHIIEKGHTKIAVLKGSEQFYSGNQRYKAFLDVLKKYNIKPHDKYIIDCEYKQQKAYEASIKLLQMADPPSIIYSFNSLMTTGALMAINKLGFKIPDDISIVGFDEVPGQEIFDKYITHIKQPAEAIGKSAVMLLIDRIEKENSEPFQKVMLEPTLVYGNSCKDIRVSNGTS